MLILGTIRTPAGKQQFILPGAGGVQAGMGNWV